MTSDKNIITARDLEYLNMAVDIAMGNIKTGGGPFGAVIACGGDIIATAGNRVTAVKDPTAHAEILAIRLAASRLGTHELSGCTLYTSCEPCPMCLGAVYWAGIERVVYSSNRFDAAEAGFSDELIYNEIALPPGDRTISFIHRPVDNGTQVFREWKDYPGKIPY